MGVKCIKGLTQGLTKGSRLLGVACSRLSDNAEDAKEKGTRDVLYYFRVCAFSIQRTRLSRSLEKAN